MEASRDKFDSLHEVVEACAEAQPRTNAGVDLAGSITYGELHRAGVRLASVLLGRLSPLSSFPSLLWILHLYVPKIFLLDPKYSVEQ